MSSRALHFDDSPSPNDFATAFVRAKRKGNVPEELKPEILEIVTQIREWTRYLHPDCEGVRPSEVVVFKTLKTLRQEANELLDNCGERPLIQSQ